MLYIRGSNRYPRSFSSVFRWCLQNGVQPIFIPVGEPWQFDDTLEKEFFIQMQFFNFAHF